MMATLKSDEQEVEVQDGEKTMNAAEQLGVPFGCRQGICGTCKVEVVEGMENLSERNDQENAMGLADAERLMCQCAIKQGLVKIRF